MVHGVPFQIYSSVVDQSRPTWTDYRAMILEQPVVSRGEATMSNFGAKRVSRRGGGEGF